MKTIFLNKTTVPPAPREIGFYIFDNNGLLEDVGPFATEHDAQYWIKSNQPSPPRPKKEQGGPSFGM